MCLEETNAQAAFLSCCASGHDHANFQHNACKKTVAMASAWKESAFVLNAFLEKVLQAPLPGVCSSLAVLA